MHALRISWDLILTLEKADNQCVAFSERDRLCVPYLQAPKKAEFTIKRLNLLKAKRFKLMTIIWPDDKQSVTVQL